MKPIIEDIKANKDLVKSGILYHLNCKWFMFNYEKFKEQYREKYVAVYEEKIIDSDTDFEKLTSTIDKTKIYTDAVFTMYVPKESDYLIRITKIR